MKIMQTAMQEEPDANLENVTCSQATDMLEDQIERLTQGLPNDKVQFSDRYMRVRKLVKHIETCRAATAPHSPDKLLRMFDSNFGDVLAVFSTGTQVSEDLSVFAQDYSFFVGGLKIYLSSLRKDSDELAFS